MVLILSNLVMKKLDPVTAPENENARNPQAHEHSVFSVHEEPKSYAPEQTQSCTDKIRFVGIVH